MENKFKKYVFTCKLKGNPVCVSFSIINGLYGDLLEECGIWHDLNKPNEYSYAVDYPLMIKGVCFSHDTTGSNAYDLKVGDVFTLSEKCNH